METVRSIGATTELIQHVVDMASCGITITDAQSPEHPFIYVNDAFCRMTGYGRQELLGKSFHLIYGSETGQSAIEKIRASIADGKYCMQDLYCYRKGGAGFYNRLHLNPIGECDGRPIHYAGIHYDLTAERRLQDLLEQQNVAFSNVLSASPSGVMILDANDMVLYSNRAAEKLLGERGLSLVGRNISLETGREGRHEIEYRTADGSIIVAEVVIVQTRWADSLARIVMIRDVTAYRAAEQRAALAESTDVLTGAANRQQLREYLDSAIDESSGRSLTALILLDIRDFHRINQRHGDSMGDQLLREIAVRLKDCVGSNDLVARTGGDNFAVAVRSVTSMDTARRLTIDMITALGKPYGCGIKQEEVVFGCGLAAAPDHADEPAGLIKCAEIALRVANRNSGHAIEVFDEKLGKREFDLQLLDSELRQAILRDQFVVYYQPQINLKDRSLAGFEALVRWRHPERGVLAPGAFIERLESLQLIATLGHDVLRKASRQVVAWDDRYSQLQSCKMAVNLSAVQLSGPEASDTLHFAITEGGALPGRISLELTESAALADLRATVSVLSRLRAYGVGLALDDFGTGYSALSHLRVLPVDTVKLDRSFISDLPDNRSDAGLVRAIIEMSHALGKKVVAEGVETLQQESFLKEIGCDCAQGFLYGPPEPADIIEQKWLSSNIEADSNNL